MKNNPEQASFLRTNHYGGVRFGTEQGRDESSLVPTGSRQPSKQVAVDDLPKKWDEADDKGHASGMTAGQIQTLMSGGDETMSEVEKASGVSAQGRVWKTQLAKKLSRRS